MSDWKGEAIERLESVFVAYATEVDPNFSKVEYEAGFERSGSRASDGVYDARGEWIDVEWGADDLPGKVDELEDELRSSIQSFRAESILPTAIAGRR